MLKNDIDLFRRSYYTKTWIDDKSEEVMSMQISIYHSINWFFGFSFLGYLLECTVLSCENKKPVLNRGFVHGPFCIIYGFGALGAFYILQRISGNVLQLYFVSMIMATLLELVTAKIMIRLFGAFWWDYSNKPFNYKGIICLESSAAWGFLGIFFIHFLDGFMSRMVGRIPGHWQPRMAVVILIYYVIDFIFTLIKQRKHLSDDSEEVIGRLKVL